MSRCVHEWRPSGKREKCAKCGTTYPCVLDCKHVDCRVDKGQELPEWIRLVEIT